MSYPPAGDESMLGRAQIATLAGVGRPTVTAWERQETDFPSPWRSNGQDYFRRSEIMDWPDRRPVPSGRLVAGEPVGTTYGDRARKGEEAGRSPADAVRHHLGVWSSYRIPTGAVDEPHPENRRIVTDLMGSPVDRVRERPAVPVVFPRHLKDRAWIPWLLVMVLFSALVAVRVGCLKVLDGTPASGALLS